MSSKESFDYSADAESVLNLFYEKDFLLYVEGDDDVPFWAAVFDEFSNASIEPIALYGATEIDKKIDEVVENDLKILIARDSDYKRIDGSIITDPRVLYTFGYSIENSLFSGDVIYDIVFSWTRGRAKEHHDAHTWLERFCNAVRELVILDLANHIHGKGLSIISDHCGIFMSSKDSPEIHQEKVNEFINTIKKSITKKEVEDAANALKNSKLDINLFVRGHFLQSAVHKYLTDRMKKAGRKPNASFDAIYSSALPSFAKLLKTEKEESAHYSQSVNLAIAAIQT